MAARTLRLYGDSLAAGATLAVPLPAAVRAVCPLSGSVDITHSGTTVTVEAGKAWLGSGETMIAARQAPASLLRYELVGPDPADMPATGANVASRLELSAGVSLASGTDFLLRCDRVLIPPSGIAYLHTHQGPGIRYLLDGRLTVETGGETHEIARGGSWFESGPEPVLARAPDDQPGEFCRVMILPRALLGRSSISYVNEEDRNKPKRQQYTILLDQFIEV